MQTGVQSGSFYSLYKQENTGSLKNLVQQTEKSFLHNRINQFSSQQNVKLGENQNMNQRLSSKIDNDALLFIAEDNDD